MYGLVTRTGFLTTKGSLVRDILYPKPIKFKFYSDGLKFVGIMAILSIVGFVCTIPVMLNIGVETGDMIDRSLDLITITVPPALPAAMTCGVVFAIQRLKRKKIFCISPPRVNVAGRVTTFVFDKTGTLTEEGLSVLGFRPVTLSAGNTQTFKEFTREAKTISEQGQWWSDNDADGVREMPEILFEEALASCTAITYVNGELIGDPLDVRMFEATQWVLDESRATSADPDN